MKHWLLVAAALFSIPASASADETLKFREVTHYASVQSQEVGDVEGHAIALGHGSGIASFPDGTVGTISIVNVLDYVKGSGSILLVYDTLTLSDGSTLRTRATGSTAVTGGKSEFNGSFIVLGGTGRFAGAKGDGTFAGARLQSLGTGAEFYDDVSINLKK
jgi:hypothetical protein